MIAIDSQGSQIVSAIAPRDIHASVESDLRGAGMFARVWKWYVTAVRRPLPREADDGGDVW